MKHLHRKPQSAFGIPLFALAALATGFMLPLPALAASITLANAPLATSTTSTVKPNVMFVLDNSGSMDWEHMPDDAGDDGSNVTFTFGYYGLRSSQCNQVYYNPAITYLPPVDSSGTAFANASFAAAPLNGFNPSTTTNLSTSFRASLPATYTYVAGDTTNQAAYYYTYSGTQTTSLQKDYTSTTSDFYKECHSASGATPGSAVFTKVVVSATSGPGLTDERTNFANWYSFYRSRLLMMKTAAGRAFSTLNSSYRVGLMKISSSGAPVVAMATFDTATGGNRNTWYTALYGMTVATSTPLLEALANAGKYYGGKLSGYTGTNDPIQYSCQQNFTIISTDGFWNDSSSPTQLNGSTAIGNPDGTLARPWYDGSNGSGTWNNIYTRESYSSSSTGCTSGTKRVIDQQQACSCTVTSSGANCATSTCGATSSDWSNYGAFTYVSPYTASSSTCAATVTLPSPTTTGRTLQSNIASTSVGVSNSLADVAAYYYNTDLRSTNCTGSVTGENVCYPNVFISPGDSNPEQHMTTFTLGLGASGRMRYSASYPVDNVNTSDYVAVKLGSTAHPTASPAVCPWQADGTVCNWPIPGATSGTGKIENIDDLWHAAVNGHGAYFSATNPTTLASGLAGALAGVQTRQGAAAAAATSTLNPVAGNNLAYVASYTTVSWKGNLEGRGINTVSGDVDKNATWCAQDVTADTCVSPATIGTDNTGDTQAYFCVTANQTSCPNGKLHPNGSVSDCWVPKAQSCTGTMDSLVASSRVIKTANSTGTGLVDFLYANLTTTQQAYFSAANISGLGQWSTLNTTQRTAAAGSNLVNYLRGDNTYDNRSGNPLANQIYRYRDISGVPLGDALESQPTFIAKPVFSYPYSGYSAFKTAKAGRAGTVYIGANDGMLHAFDAGNGSERWAYVPSMVMSNMWQLASTTYATNHVNFVNGSPIISDVCTATDCSTAAASDWKTILVGGLNGGGRGYYAMDITDPATPVLLWEFTTASDSDVGYSYGRPVIARKADGKWVVLVTSGYNNTSPGTGVGFLYVLNAGTGAIISKISTGVGNTTTPSGLAQIAVWNDESAGNKAGYVYGGDLLGNLWRFNINDTTTTAVVGKGSFLKFATLFSDSGGSAPQPITTTPILGTVSSKNVIFVGTGKYLETGDLTTTQVQSLYAIKDDGATTTFVNPRTHTSAPKMIQQTITQPSGSSIRTGSTNAVDFSVDQGWFVDFPDTSDASPYATERENIDGKLVQGTLIIPTLVPSSTACSPGGFGWLNYFNYADGSPVDPGGTGANSNVSKKYDSQIVGIFDFFIDGVAKLGVMTVDKNVIDPDVKFDAPPGGFTGKRGMWRELVH
jgi:type IV pilus assembly protein PilY1